MFKQMEITNHWNDRFYESTECPDCGAIEMETTIAKLQVAIDKHECAVIKGYCWMCEHYSCKCEEYGFTDN